MAVNGTRRQYSCPARFIRMGNSCYFMSTHMASWHEAHFKCRNMGAVLAAFEKRNENRNMRKYLMREELAPLARWIGGIYQWQKRFWMWGSTGHAVAYKAFSPRMVNRDWAWHCISMDPISDYRWRPAGCMEAKHYICETPLRRHHDHLRNKPRTPGQGQGQGQGRAGGSRHQKGPRRRPVSSDAAPGRDKAVMSVASARGGIGVTVPARRRFQHHRFGSTAPASQRWTGTTGTTGTAGTRTTPSSPPSSPSPPPPTRGETVHRRPFGPHNRPYGYHPPGPPPQPQPGSGRARPAGSGATAGATRHQAYQYGGSSSYFQGPRPRPGAEPWRQPFQMPEHLAEATVHSIYTPPSNSENNDISNDV